MDISFHTNKFYHVLVARNLKPKVHENQTGMLVLYTATLKCSKYRVTFNRFSLV